MHIIKKMVMEQFSMKMEQFLKEFLKTIERMDMEN